MAKNKKCVSCIAEIVCKAYEDDSRCVSFFAELAEALKPSHNSDYMKCSTEVLKVINFSSSSVHGQRVIEVIKRHFI
jgi:hypothetical protein